VEILGPSTPSLAKIVNLKEYNTLKENAKVSISTGDLTGCKCVGSHHTLI
jgi:hypothetical protein